MIKIFLRLCFTLIIVQLYNTWPKLFENTAVVKDVEKIMNRFNDIIRNYVYSGFA